MHMQAKHVLCQAVSEKDLLAYPSRFPLCIRQLQSQFSKTNVSAGVCETTQQALQGL